VVDVGTPRVVGLDDLGIDIGGRAQAFQQALGVTADPVLGTGGPAVEGNPHAVCRNPRLLSGSVVM
jgi:hypothetical protein